MEKDVDWVVERGGDGSGGGNDNNSSEDKLLGLDEFANGKIDAQDCFNKLSLGEKSFLMMIMGLSFVGLNSKNLKMDDSGKFDDFDTIFMRGLLNDWKTPIHNKSNKLKWAALFVLSIVLVAVSDLAFIFIISICALILLLVSFILIASTFYLKVLNLNLKKGDKSGEIALTDVGRMYLNLENVFGLTTDDGPRLSEEHFKIVKQLRGLLEGEKSFAKSIGCTSNLEKVNKVAGKSLEDCVKNLEAVVTEARLLSGWSFANAGKEHLERFKKEMYDVFLIVEGSARAYPGALDLEDLIERYRGSTQSFLLAGSMGYLKQQLSLYRSLKRKSENEQLAQLKGDSKGVSKALNTCGKFANKLKTPEILKAVDMDGENGFENRDRDALFENDVLKKSKDEFFKS